MGMFNGRGGLGCTLVSWVLSALVASCGQSGSKTTPRATPPAVTSFAVVSSQSTNICRLEGDTHRRPGVYGTDLGMSFLQPQGNPGETKDGQHIVVLFGDTEENATFICDYPPPNSDDLQISLPAIRPAVLAPGSTFSDAGAHSVCDDAVYPPPDPNDPARPRPTRVFPDASDHSDDKALNTGAGRTPDAGFSDGTHAFGIFVRGDPKNCKTSADCPTSMMCTSDPGYTGEPLGVCDPPYQVTEDPAPAICRRDANGSADCGKYRTCIAPPEGVCIERAPFQAQTPSGPVTPSWYTDDPRRGLALNLYIGSEFWPDRPEDYATGFKFLTNKFVNPSVRTVAHFDPANPSKNDYRPGTETLLMWGRPTFQGRQGYQGLMFLLYQPLANLIDAQGNIAWAPHYFAGYDADGNPKWSTDDGDALPVYGADATVGEDARKPTLVFPHPEFDVVNEMSLTYVESLGRWVMLYGGDLPRFLRYDARTNTELTDTYPEPTPGAIHMRTATHPWGRATRDAAASQDWTEPVAVLTREEAAPFLGCDPQAPALAGCTTDHDVYRPLQLLLEVDQEPNITPAEYPMIQQACLDGDATRDLTYNLSGDQGGHLYAPEILEPWTDDATKAVPGLAPGERAVDLYWTVATWNPYGVVLYKTEIVARPEP